MTLNVTVSGTDRRLKFDWPAASRAWAASVAPEATALMKAHAPFRTGAMRQGISSRIEETPESTSVVLYSTAPYAPFVIGGTQPHTITARNARALRWVGRGGMGVNFATRVNHPGTKPDDFPEQAMTVATPMLLSRFSEAVQEAIVVD